MSFAAFYALPLDPPFSRPAFSAPHVLHITRAVNAVSSTIYHKLLMTQSTRNRSHTWLSLSQMTILW